MPTKEEMLKALIAAPKVPVGEPTITEIDNANYQAFLVHSMKALNGASHHNFFASMEDGTLDEDKYVVLASMQKADKNGAYVIFAVEEDKYKKFRTEFLKLDHEADDKKIYYKAMAALIMKNATKTFCAVQGTKRGVYLYSYDHHLSRKFLSKALASGKIMASTFS